MTFLYQIVFELWGIITGPWNIGHTDLIIFMGHLSNHMELISKRRHFFIKQFYISAKYHKNIPKGLWLTKRAQNQWIITVRHNKGRYVKSKKGRVVILVHDMWSVLFYISIKYHKNIPKGLWLKERNEINGLSVSNITKGDNAKSKEGRVVIHVPDTLSGPVLHFYQVW